jgi:DNA-binding transcriptional ArsR family regulator
MTHTPLPQPDADQISLANVLAALGDQTRLSIIGHLARAETGATCGQLTELASKTGITYHVAKLREAGIVRVQPEGTRRRVTLRRADLDSRFPGFLDSIIASVGDPPPLEGYDPDA